MVRVVPNYRGERPKTDAGDNDCLVPFGGDVNALDGPKNMKLVYGLRQAMLLNGVDWWGLAGMTTRDHTPEVIDATVKAFETAVEAVTAEGLV
jgi:glutamate-1-semialdehyde 2,1-aminomutase